MASFQVKYQVFLKGTSGGSVGGTSVNADSASEARQIFKSRHIDSTTKKYKIISVVKSGK
jgi:hypothetical protein